MDFNKPHIYRRQIIATGKYYVGKHNGNNEKYKGSGREYLKDYKKYVKNPEIDLKEEILEYVEDISKLNEREIYWLEYFDAANNPLFYNKTNKSYGCGKLSKKSKEKMSLSSPFRKKIIQYSIEGKFIKIWDCMSIVAKKFNISTGDLTCCCKGKQHSAGGFRWKYYRKNYKKNLGKIKYFKGTKEWLEKITLAAQNRKYPEGFGKHRNKIVLQYDLQGNFIKEWESIKKAAIELFNIEEKRTGIVACCRGQQKKAYGFIWKYKI